MPIFLAILGAIGSGLFMWLVWGNGMDVINQWLDGRAQQKKEAQDARAIADARDRALRAPLRAVEDPREAALVLLARLAQARGEMTPEQRAAIADLAREKLDLDEKLEHQIAVAEFAAKQAPSNMDVINDLAPLFQLRLTEEEVADLIGMVDAVGALHGGPTEAQITFITRLEARLGFKREA